MASGAWDSWTTLAASDPDSIAVVCGADRRTFADLTAHARHAGVWLLANGVAPRRRVVLVLDDGLDLLQTLGAALAVGAEPVVVDATVNADDLHGVVDSTDATAVVHRAGSDPVVAKAAKRVQKRWRPVDVDLGTLPAVKGTVDDTALAPRGVEAGTVVLVAPPPGSTDPVTSIDTSALAEAAVGDGAHLVLGSLTHGAGLLSALATLGAGHPLVLPAPGWDVDDVLAAVDQEHVTRVTVDAGGRALGRAVATAFPHIGVVVAATADHTDARDVAAERRTIIVPGGTVDVDRVETRVESHRGVAACRVVALATRSGPPAIVALVVAAERNYLDAAELRAWARLKLAAHETPRAWLLVDAIDPDATDAELRAIAVERLRVR